MDGLGQPEVEYIEHNDLREMARRAVRSHLYDGVFNQHSHMRQVLITNANSNGQQTLKKLIIANYRKGNNSVDIGCALVMRNGCVMVFVRPAYRRCGIAKEMINRLLVATNRCETPLFAWFATAEAIPDSFWKKFNIPVLGDRTNSSKERQRGQLRTFSAVGRR